MAESLQKRQTAFKIRIADILKSEYKKREGFSPNYLEINRTEVSRVNLIGAVVDKAESENYNTLVVDDGTGKIPVRSFESNAGFEKINVGDFALVVGRPREFNGEKYLHLEIISKVDPKWAKVRKLELEKSPDKQREGDGPEKEVEEETVDETPKNKVLRKIKELDNGEGVSVEDIQSSENVDEIVSSLLKEGDVFEVKPGKLKVLE